MPSFFSNFTTLPQTSLRRTVWLAFLILATIGLSLSFNCATPFVALAAAAALSLPRNTAILFVLSAWVVNQAVGFGILGYPTDSTTLTWGGIMGICAVASAIIASFAANRSTEFSAFNRIAITFIAAFIGFQGTLLIGNLYMIGGLDAFTLSSKIFIAKVNIIALAALWGANRLATMAGILHAPQPTGTVTA